MWAFMERVLAELRGGLWHTTRPDYFRAILKSGAILPEPDIPEKERHGPLEGQRGHPYVRTLGGVSLFDFTDFDPAYQEERYRSSYAYFVPCQLQWESAVWIEIDREIVAPNLIEPRALLAKWKSEKSVRRFMAEIEAAHIGPIPASAFKRAFLVTRKAETIEELKVP
jgi:hypothetical protein